MMLSTRLASVTTRWCRAGYGLDFVAGQAIPGLDMTRLSVAGPIPAQAVRLSLAPRRFQPDAGQWVSPGIRVASHEAWVQVAGVGEFFIRNGQQVAIFVEPGAEPDRLAHQLMGLVLGLVLLQRGRFALHASGVDLGGRCVAFMGPKGAGKSTLAAHFQQRGLPVLFDDACALDAEGRAWPGPPRLKLNAESLAGLGRPSAGLRAVGMDPSKFYVDVPAGPDSSLQLDRIYLLAGNPDDPIQRLQGAAAFGHVWPHIPGHAWFGAMGRLPALTAECVALLRRVPVYRVALHRGFARLGAEADRLVRHCAEVGR